MSTLVRIWPYVRPNRRKLLLSFVFAALVALLWGGNLAVVFPIVKVLLQGEGLEDYVDQQIAETELQISNYEKGLNDVDERISTVQDEIQSVDLWQRKARSESKLTSASYRLAGLRWVKVYIMPFVPADPFHSFALILAMLLVMTMGKLLCMLAEEVLLGDVVQRTIMRLRQQAFRQTLLLDYQTLSQVGTPQLMSRFTFDMETLSSGLALLGGKVIREPLKAAACMGFAFWVNWRLTLLSLLFVPLALIVFHRMGLLLKRASHRSAESMSRIYKVLEETFESVKVVIAFGGSYRHRQKHHRENKTYYQKSMQIVVIDALTSPATELLGMIAVFVAMLPGAYLVLRETNTFWGIRLTTTKMDIAELSLLYAMLAGVIDPVRKLSSVFSKLKKASASADRIFELMDQQTLVHDSTAPRPLPETFHTIRFQEVGFTYAQAQGHNRPPVLHNVSLAVRAGEVIAVVGENGSGKSTLVNLLPRFYDPDFGSVHIDGVDVRDVSLAELRSRVGVVTQETLLFDDTIHENIRYGCFTASIEEIEQAAEQAHVTQFLAELPDGFRTRVGERGACLSGGQRQRIALARAMLRNPSILILDEATSAVDSQSELLIHQALKKFVQNRTAFIITHSVTPSMLELVTRIIVMDQGRLVAAGTHEELLASCPTYERLYHAQTKSTSPATPEAPASAVPYSKQRSPRPDKAVATDIARQEKEAA